MPQAAPTRPFWTLNKIYWLLYILPLSAWFAMDGTEMFYLDTDARHPERVWFKLGVYLLIVNFITILVFREDKKRAERGDWRVSEKTLVYLITLGALPGALLAMRMYSHKTAKWGLQLRFFFWAALEVVFTFALLPHTFSYANDARWGICLFSLFWWNLHVAAGIVGYLKGRPKERAKYLLTLAGAAAACLGVVLGGIYLRETLTGRQSEVETYVRVGVLCAGALLVVFNEVTLSVKKIRGKLPGWDPAPPAGAAA